MKMNRYLFLVITVIVTAFIYSCDILNIADKNTNNETLNITEETIEDVTYRYGQREPTMAIDNEQMALEIGTIILKNYFTYYYESLFGILDRDEYWFVYSYMPDRTNEDGYGGYVGGGTSVTFRKSDCKIIDIGIED